MHPNSRAYQDAWQRVRDAIKAEAVTREIVLPDAVLDDMACEATYAAFGMCGDAISGTIKQNKERFDGHKLAKCPDCNKGR